MSRPHGVVAAAGLALLLATACGGGSSKKDGGGPYDGSASDGGRDNGGVGDAGADTPPGCSVLIRPIVPESLDMVVAGPGARVRVQGEITGTPGAGASWVWRVKYTDTTDVPFTHVRDEPGLIEFPVAAAGDYVVTVDLKSSVPCTGTLRLVARPLGAALAILRVRVEPPPASGLPAQETEVQVAGGTPSGGNRLPLSSGLMVSVDPGGVGGPRLPSYVRITSASGGLLVEGHSGASAFKVPLAPDRYDVLVVPDGDVAPALWQNLKPSEIVALKTELSAGVLVSGTVSDGGGAAVAGARVVLRAGVRPSTVGESSSDGGYAVHTRGGSHAATIVPAAASTLPRAWLSGDTGDDLLLADGDGSVTLNFQYAERPQVTLAMDVRDAGAAAVPFAPVHLETADDIIDVGTLTMVRPSMPPVVRAARGTVKRDGKADAAGHVVFAGLPEARYRVTVLPDKGAPERPVGGALVDLSAGSVTDALVTLSPKVKVAGVLHGASAAAADVQVVALDLGGDVPPTALVTRTDDAGSFDLALSPGRRFLLRAEPDAAGLVARTELAVVEVPSTPPGPLDKTMRKGLFWGGKVFSPALSPVSGAVITVFCTPASAGCDDPSAPIAEAVSRSDGFFALTVPDPGTE